MDKEKLTVPFEAINPMYQILRYEWFIYYLSLALDKKKKVNLFVIQNMDWKRQREKYGTLRASFHKKKLVEGLGSLEDLTLIGDYEKNKILIMSSSDIEDSIVHLTNKENYLITMGSTASFEKDNEFSVINRALKALSTAQRKKITSQVL